jgi:hypothetical protein
MQGVDGGVLVLLLECIALLAVTLIARLGVVEAVVVEEVVVDSFDRETSVVVVRVALDGALHGDIAWTVVGLGSTRQPRSPPEKIPESINSARLGINTSDQQQE